MNRIQAIQSWIFCRPIRCFLYYVLCFFCFNVRPSDSCLLFQVRHIIGCTNHDIVGICSEHFWGYPTMNIHNGVYRVNWTNESLILRTEGGPQNSEFKLTYFFECRLQPILSAIVRFFEKLTLLSHISNFLFFSQKFVTSFIQIANVSQYSQTFFLKNIIIWCNFR